MQKRLLALVATVAMVLSMFAGIAFAAEATKITGIAKPVATAGKFSNEANVNALMDALWAADTGVFSYDSASNTLTINVANISANDTLFTQANWGSNSVPVRLVLDEDTVTGLTKDANWDEGLAYHDWIGLDAKDNGTVTRNIPGTGLSYKVKYVGGQSTHKYSVQLGTKKFISSGETPGFQQIIGTITGVRGKDDEDLQKNFVIKYTVKGVEQTVNAVNGQFSFYLPTDIPAQDITLNVYTEGGTTPLQSEGKNVTAKIEVRYNVSTTPTELKFNRDEPIVVSGKVTDSHGKPVAETSVSLSADVTNPSLPDSLKTNKDGEFAFVVYNWKAAGEYQLKINNENHKKVTVDFAEAKLTVTPNSGVVRKIAPVKFEVKGSGYESGIISVELKKGTTKVEGIDFSNIPDGAIEDGAFEGYFTWTPEEVGTYTLTVKRGDYRASATITVTNPVSYNLINGSKLEELGVGDNEVVFGKADNEVHLVQFMADGNTTDAFVYSVYVDGKLAKLKGTDTVFEKLAGGTINIATKKLGTKTIKVVAYKADDTTKSVFEKTITAKVVGWDVTLEPAELTVKQAQDVVVVVKDDEGNAINNATIEIVDVKTIAAGSINVQNGTYTLKDIKVNTPGTKKVRVWKGAVGTAGGLMAELNLEVVGEKVYSVTADVDALLQGKAQDVKLTVTKDGVAVMPQRIKWVYEDGTSGEAYPSYLGDGVSKVEVKATKAGELVVRAENFDGTLCGETTIEVVAPQLVLIDEETVNLTENFKTTVNFKVVDPRDGSAIKSNLAITGRYADIAVYDANDGIIVPGLDKVVNVLGDEEYTLTILATNADYEAAEEEEKVVAVALEVNDAELDAHFEIKEATISSDPGMIVIGANNNLTITFADANGKPIVGKQMYVGETKLDKTDEDGQIIYPVSVATSGVTIKGDTDAKDEDDKVIKVEHTIKIGYDAEAPKVDYELDGNKATIVISDNVRLVRINIDGKEVDFWPGAKYEFVRTLQPGVNKFHIKAQDSNDNVFDEVVEIEYLTDAIVLEGDKVNRQGEFLFVQARQFADFGAKFAWNQETKTARFVLDETTVEVTIGSTTAKVNGETVTMPVAPFLANDRTYVPVRFVSENLGWGVHWKAGDIVTITLP